ncbi:hypothetical protein ABPG77_002777 [Micractinium sp. CCAP 211/92]
MRQGSFVRKGAAPAADPGTRPGLYGQTLVSSGHPDLDRLLGGGLPLGSLQLLLEDGWSGHHATLLRYFLAEGAACGQSVLLAAAHAPAGGLAAFVPAQLRAGRAADKDEEEGQEEEFKLRIAWQYRRYIKTDQAASAGPAGTLMPGSSNGGSGGLRASRAPPVAGSMGSSAGRVSSGGSSGRGRKPAGLKDWCHQFDLLKPAGEEGLALCRAELVECSPAAENSGSGSSGGSGSMQRLLSSAASFVAALAPPPPPQQQQPAVAVALAGAGQRLLQPAPPTAHGPQGVGRLAVLSLGSLGWQAPQSPQQLHLSTSSSGDGAVGGSGAGGGASVLRALLQLKGLVRDRRCVAMVSVPAALFSPSDLARMQHVADGVIALESVADGADIVRLAPDAASVAGLLHLRKLPALGTAAPPAPEVALHLIRHKRRRLAITPVEIDPDAEMADSEAASGLGRSVASVLCGGPPKASKLIDF